MTQNLKASQSTRPGTTVPTVLITGATSGIGRHAALTLARKGLRVIATGRSADKLAELTREAAADNLDLETAVLDVTDPASIEATRDAALALTRGRGIDALVNNAGYGEMGPMETISDERLRAQFETNVFGLMAVTRAFLPQMHARGAGRVINVGSIGGTITLPLFGAYNATKYALESMSDALRLELRPFGIFVSLIQPGPINTEFTSRSVDTAAAGAGDPVYAGAMAAAQDMERTAERLGVSPAATSRAIYRAITARRPRARYATPWFASWGVKLVRLLPTSWRDSLLRQSSGLTRKRLLGAPQAPATRGEIQSPSPSPSASSTP